MSRARAHEIGTLRGEGLALRPCTDADYPVMSEQIAHPSVVEWWGPHPPDRLRRDFDDDESFAWVIEVDGEIAGHIQATERRWDDDQDLEVDLYVADGHQGRGLGPSAIRVLLRHFFDERGHHRAVICPAAANERAIRAYEKVGFRPVGILRQADRPHAGAPWRDALLMDILAGELR